MADILLEKSGKAEKPDILAGYYDTSNLAPDGTYYSNDSILVKFFLAQVLALSVAAIHGVFQRLPFMAEWLREADYGGHLFTNLGLTHINVVLGGTISIAGLTYYVLPRLLKRRLFSETLCNISFWFTFSGVLGFYMALLPIGLTEGALVHQGYTYTQAKDIVGFWHKAPEAITASAMGIGYWLFVTNVVMTIWSARRQSNREQIFAAKFFVVSVVALLLGTLQGVYQVLPWSLDWLYKVGAAGQLIDPMSHAHMNLVGGCVFAFAGFVYYFLPRITGKPVYSIRLANFSFWSMFIGVFTFWLVLIILGFIEGDMVISQGITPIAAKQAVGFWHPLLISSAASIMLLGFWTFIANIALTLKQGIGQSKERFLAVGLGFTAIALFISTSQGILQVIPSFTTWLDQAREAGEMITPLSHAQMNIIGVVTLTLVTCGMFAVPRMVNRRLYSYTLAKFSITMIVVGVSLLYVILVVLGVTEGNIIREGNTFAQARAAVTGDMHDWILVGLYAIIGTAYLTYAYNLLRTMGKATLAKMLGKAGDNLQRTTRYLVAINVPRATLEQAQRSAILANGTISDPDFSGVVVSSTTAAADSGSLPAANLTTIRKGGYVTRLSHIVNINPWKIFALEVVPGIFGFLGVGWLLSRRPAMAVLLFTGWQALFWICFWAVAVLMAPDWLPIFVGIYLILPFVSGWVAAQTYRKRAAEIKREVTRSLISDTAESTLNKEQRAGVE
ncbi:MAG: cbb3-type cytochrome c oxidase subunit I [Chloroflexi bacterium]|uniref:Cbb3-type cytochrome c oxidase subunit I n=1 Tax=Candidatus Chlorohelix allophototropha TaxID=3003348 RepID=A0A8T7LZY4_9CHLR|nr:cbb3-type cytochrome c oxidase subunit I [Chloroflexota bacterium]WJW67773.1 cbb3-type cytochrome c oxidase subunit I [Chloroflexota bacterium L227-S17]